MMLCFLTSDFKVTGSLPPASHHFIKSRMVWGTKPLIDVNSFLLSAYLKYICNLPPKCTTRRLMLNTEDSVVCARHTHYFLHILVL